MDLFTKFKEEIQEDAKFDQMNILDRQLMLPALKHKWVARLIEQKQNKMALERKRKTIKEDVLKKLNDEGLPPGIPKAALNARVEASDAIKKIDEELEQSSLLIDYLERVEKIMGSMTFDISNATKLMVMETS